MEIEVIRLQWKKMKDYTDAESHSGVYQIYGDSPIYGMNTLLYIGQASNLRARLIDHIERNSKSFITRQPSLSFRIAYAETSQITLIEEILINWHKPSFNSNSIISLQLKSRSSKVLLLNEGERGLLNLAATNLYHLPDFESIGP